MESRASFLLPVVVAISSACIGEVSTIPDATIGADGADGAGVAEAADAATADSGVAAVCGDQRRDLDEQCDDGSANGSAASCCDATCHRKTDSTPCDDGNYCTKEDACSGGVCAATAYSCAPSECRLTSTCDGAGGCTMMSKPDGTSCSTGTCQGGVCSAAGLVAFWKLDEGSGTTLGDSSTNDRSANLNGNVTWASGKRGSAIGLNGIDAYAETGISSALPFFSVVTWIKAAAAPSSSQDSGPVMKEENFILSWDHTNDAFRRAVGVRVGGEWYSASFGSVTIDTWHQLAATYDGDTLNAYVDGQLVTSNSAPSGPADNDPAHSLKLGRHAVRPAFFAGAIDETRLYDHAITAAEVLSLYEDIAGRPVCGNGAQETGEDCDDGAANGAATSCCSATCEAVNATACDDGEACTKDDRCSSGKCVGTAYSCTATSCQESSVCDQEGGCIVTSKQDGTACTRGTCQAGVCQSNGATWHVAPNGNDGSGNGTPGAPWATLSHACSQVREFGDAIEVRAGAYHDDAPCDLAPGVSILGAGKDAVTIHTAANPFVRAESGIPSIDGSNEISGISFFGTGGNNCIFSAGRNNQRIKACHFEDFYAGISIRGKLRGWSDSCSGPASDSAFYCENHKLYSSEPAPGDWATGAEINDNTMKNAKIFPETIKDALIHHNTIDNRTSLKSGVGNTSFYWSGVKFFSNTIYTQTIAWSTIAVEVWLVSNDCQFYDNTTDGWFSILSNPHGPNLPYSFRVVNNTFRSAAPRGIGSGAVITALEVGYHVQNILVEGNYFENTTADDGYKVGIAIWGYGQVKNYHVRNNVVRNLDIAVQVSSNDGQEVPFDGSDFYIYNNLFDGGPNQKGIILIEDGVGTIRNIVIKNNIFINGANAGYYQAAVIYPAGHDVTGCTFTHNIVQGGDFVSDAGGNGWSGGVSNNFAIAPELTSSGNRPDPYYRPSSASSNVVDRGTASLAPGVTISGYAGAAPDIGAYEWR
ncbi:MAG: hypothetical protein HY901_04355 [Deltaproteobacteria bacterium]|nr:hypothetical protein [Deltaproteobacteria bacterium]